MTELMSKVMSKVMSKDRICYVLAILCIIGIIIIFPMYDEAQQQQNRIDWYEQQADLIGITLENLKKIVFVPPDPDPSPVFLIIVMSALGIGVFMFIIGGKFISYARRTK